jgi:hypothetical protein
MVEAVHTHFEALSRKALAEVRRHVVCLSHEVKGRPESQTLFEFDKVQTPLLTLCCFHIMGEDQSESFSIGPSCPTLRRTSSLLVDRPYMGIADQFIANLHSPHFDLQTARDERL